MRDYAKNSPPVSSFLVKQGDIELPDDVHSLSIIFDNQKKWHNEFKDFIRMHSNNICLVGNSASLLNKEMGDTIDKNRVVIRFNDYCTEEESSEQFGKSIDVWVRSPSFSVPQKLLNLNVSWTVISGPDIFYSLSDWSNTVKMFTGSERIITPPLAVWRELVIILDAPPSSGILTIAWIIKIVGAPKLVRVAGFQSSTKNIEENQYHYNSMTHKAGERHNWYSEKKLLNQWQEDGLVFLDRNSND